MAVFTPGYLTLRLTSPPALLRRRWELDPNNLHPVAACKKVDNGASIISLQVQRLKRWGKGKAGCLFRLCHQRTAIYNAPLTINNPLAGNKGIVVKNAGTDYRGTPFRISVCPPELYGCTEVALLGFRNLVPSTQVCAWIFIIKQSGSPIMSDTSIIAPCSQVAKR